MDEPMQKVSDQISGLRQSVRAMYRANRALILSGLTLMSILLIVWARLGFTFQVSQFFAATPHTPSVLTVQCGTTNTLSWTLPAGHDSNTILRAPNGGAPVVVYGGSGNVGGATATGATFIDTGVQAGVTYVYTHKAWADTASNAVTCPPGGSPTGSAGTGTLSVQCGATQNVLSWTADVRADSNAIQRGNSGPKNLPNCQSFFCWLPSEAYPHQKPTATQPATYTDTQLQAGECYFYRVKYTGDVASNQVACPSGCDVVATATPSPTATPTATSTATPSPTTTPTPTGAPLSPTVDVQCGDGDPDTGAQGPCHVAPGRSFYISWASTNATQCQTVGPWTSPGPRPTEGPAQAEAPHQSTQDYTLTCTGPGGTASDFVTVTIDATPAPSLTPTPEVLPLGCFPDRSSILVGQTVHVEASGGSEDANHLWQLSPDGTIQSQCDGTHPCINAVFATTGTKTVTVSTSAGQIGTCTVRVTSGQVGTVPTGPGDAVVAAFLVSAIMTLLYVSYTHTSVFRRREVDAITAKRDPLDFRS